MAKVEPVPCPKCSSAVEVHPQDGGRGTGDLTSYYAECTNCGWLVGHLSSTGRKDSAIRDYNRWVREEGAKLAGQTHWSAQRKAATAKVALAPPRDIPVAGIKSALEEPCQVKIACPQCGSKNLTLMENWARSIEWTVTDGWMDRASGSKLEGKPVGVVATCTTCQHDWTPRNAPQIESVLESTN